MPTIKVKVVTQPRVRIKTVPQPRVRMRVTPALIPADGEAATIEVGTVTTLPPGSPATVQNVGTPNAAIFDFAIPEGEAGAGQVKSVNGQQGVIVLDAADVGAAATAHTHAAADITDFSTAADARVSAAIGVTVQAYSANLAEWSSINPSANGGSLVSAADYAAMRALLDLEVGTDVQAHSANLDEYAAVNPTTAGLALLDDAAASDQRATLGLGTAATVNTGTGGATVPLLNASNTFSATQTITGSASFFNPLIIESTDASANAGPYLNFRRSSASPAASDGLGSMVYQARDSGGNLFNAAEVAGVLVDPTDGSEDTELRLFAMFNGASGGSIRICNGVQIASPTGGFQGSGTLNAVGVYDDSVLLTCMALAKEFRESKTIDLKKWDAMVPDLIVPEQRRWKPVMVETTVVRTMREEDGSLVRKEVIEKQPAVELEPVWDEDGNGIDAVEQPLVEEIIEPAQTIERVHGTARVFKAMIESGFDPRDPEQYFAKMQADEALPGMPTQADWKHNKLSIGDQFSRKWLAMEMLAIVSAAMWARLKDMETRVAALEGQRSLR